MNLLKSPLRRTSAIVAGALVGLAGAVALAAPASAHHPIVEPVSACKHLDGTWKVDWKVTNSEWDLEGQIEAVATEPDLPVTGITVGTTLPKSHDGDVTGTEDHIPANVDQVTLKVQGHWVRNGQPIDSWNSGAQNKPEQTCTDEHPTPPSPSTSPTPSAPPTEKPSVGEPTPILDVDCTTMTIGLKNPADGRTITLDFETKKGEKRTTVIKPGETKSEKFSATPGFWVKVTPHGIDDAQPETINYEQPADCATSGSGGGLPVTGAAAGSIAGGAAILLAAGVVLFVVARRRKVKFTA